MQHFLSKNKFVFITFLVAFAVLFFFYHEVLLSPNNYLFSPHGDGIKNYYTYIYHAQYDDAFHHFSGMNYPYYEHIVYTDAHPLLSWLIGKLGLVIYGIGILNFFMLLSYPIAAIFLFKILRHYKVSSWWAVAGAVAIAFMSPQVFRLTGHFSMSYAFAVPVMWWLLIKHFSTRKWIWSVAIALYMLGFFFTHPYLGIILAFFSIVFWLVYMIVDRGKSAKKRMLEGFGNILIQTIIPLVIFQGYVALTDVHIDRLSEPAGFFHYYASWRSLLVAHDGPLSPIYRHYDIRVGDWESWAYLGFSTIIFALIIGVYLIRKRTSIAFKALLRTELFLFLIAAYLILLFAFCFPLKFDWMRWVTDFFGPLKQFRILGRFTWIFFHVFTIASIVGIHRLYLKNKSIAYPIVFFAGIVFYTIEFYPPHKNTSGYITVADNKFKPENIEPDMQEIIDLVNNGGYDAILFLPFQHMSSENLMMLGTEKANYDAFLISYHTHLPLVNSISSRMSLTESINANNYFSPGFVEKKLTYDIPEGDRIILIKNKDLLKTCELRMVWESEQIFENNEFVAFDFDQEKWNSRERYDRIIAQEKEATEHVGEGWRSDTSKVWFIYESFDNSPVLETEIGLGATGAYKDLKSSWNTILELTPEQIEPGNYVIRYWYYLREDRPDVLAVMEEKYGEEKPGAWIAQFDVKQSTMVVDHWCLVEMEFTVAPDMEQINVLITGNGSQEPFIVDELLIQKQNDPALFRQSHMLRTGVDGYSRSYVIYNNYWLKTDAFE